MNDKSATFERNSLILDWEELSARIFTSKKILKIIRINFAHQFLFH